MIAALLIFAFTAGLVLSPAVAALFRALHKKHSYSKERKAITLLESLGYTVDFKQSTADDDTVVTDMNWWLDNG